MSGNKAFSSVDEYEKTNKFWIVLAVALFVVGMLHTYWYRYYQPDDAFIYLVYVKSVFSGLGLTFNGQLVEGYSSVLWTLLVALFSWTGIDPLAVSKWLGWASYIALAFMLIKAHRMTGGAAYGSLFSLAIYFSVPSLAMWSAGAMETMLFSALIALSAGLYYYSRLICESKFYFLFSGVCFALVALTRPEGFALFGAVLAFEFILLVHGRTPNWWGLLITFSAYSLLTAMMFVGRWLVYGKWFPATVGAKTGSLSMQMQHGFGYLTGFAQEYILLVAFYFLSLVYVATSVRKKNIEQYLLVWMLVILVAGYLAFNWLVGGDWMIGWRFITPVLPFVAISIGIALSHVGFKFSVPLLGMVVVALLVNSLELHRLCVEELKATRGAIVIGKYIEEMGLSKHEKIAVVDAGAIPYYSELPTIDMVGLNDSYLSDLPGGFMQKYDNGYVLRNEPKVVQFHTRHIDEAGSVAAADDFIGSVNLFYSSEFQRWYEHDTGSPIPQLFVRRGSAAESTFMDTFFDAKISGLYESGRLKLELKKTGDGVWVAPIGSHISAGSVYIRVRILNGNGNVFREQFLPIKSNMANGDMASFELELETPGSGSYKVSACPILVGVREMTPCLMGEGYEYVSDIGGGLNVGVYNFNNEHLGLVGWAGMESEYVWSLGRSSSIRFNVEDVGSINRVVLNLMPFGKQEIMIELNGVKIYQGKLDAPGEVVLNASGHLKKENVLHIRHPGARQPGANDQRFVAVALRQLALE